MPPARVGMTQSNMSMPRAMACEHVLRRADPHQITRTILRQQRRRGLDHGEHRRLPLAHRKATDGIAVEADRDQRLGASLAQIGIDAPLHDAEQGLARLGQLETRASIARPSAATAPSRSSASSCVAGNGRAFVEHHLDIGAEQTLHLDGALRRERDAGAVEMRLEGDAVLLDASGAWRATSPDSRRNR